MDGFFAIRTQEIAVNWE